MTNIPAITINPLDVDLDLGGSLALNLGGALALNIGPLDINLHPITINPLDITLQPIEIKPLDISIRIKEIPSVRVSLPMDYNVCFRLYGAEVASIRLCGQGQVITEPYVPNPCECRGLRQANIVALEAEPPPAGRTG